MKLCIWFALFLITLGTPLFAATNMLTENWITPDHSTVTVYPCGDKMLCIKLIEPADKMAKDDKNPDESLRKRPLCGLQIGRDFLMTDLSHAKEGKSTILIPARL
jgi:Uncharacterized protein conserved in bacteria (DUF2147)